MISLLITAALQAEQPDLRPDMTDWLSACGVNSAGCPVPEAIELPSEPKMVCIYQSRREGDRVVRLPLCSISHTGCRASRADVARRAQAVVEEKARQKAYGITYSGDAAIRHVYLLQVRPEQFYRVRLDLSGVPENPASGRLSCLLTAEALLLTRAKGALVPSSDTFTNDITTSIRAAVR
jgi:hypothetical protein